MHYWQRKTQAVNPFGCRIVFSKRRNRNRRLTPRRVRQCTPVFGQRRCKAEFDGLEAAETFAEISEVPPGSNTVESKWLLKWKGDEHGMIDGAKVRVVAEGYSQVEGVDDFDTFAPAASTTSNRLVQAMACKLDWDLRHMDVDQAFIQSWIPKFS